MIYVIEDDEIMAECIATAAKKSDQDVQVFHDAITAVSSLDDNNLPSLILLDVLLTGPDGFTLLNELASYENTAKIPIIIITSLDLKDQDLSPYGVVKVLDKAKMYPKEITDYVARYSH